MIKDSSNEIYECVGVYGDEEMFLSRSQRLDNMLFIARNLGYTPNRILDIGCGTGYFLERIREIYPKAEYYGIDVSQSAIRIASEKYPDTKFLIADAEKALNFPEGFFDVIISGENIEHVKDVDTYLTNINQVIKDDAILILTTPNLASWFNRILLLFGRQPFYLDPSLRKTLPIFSYFGRTFPENLNNMPAGHLRLYTLDMLKKLLNLYGFETKQVLGAPFLRKPLIGRFDELMSKFPSLACSLALKVTKVKKI